MPKQRFQSVEATEIHRISTDLPLQILLNLSADIKVESKMVKRGLLALLARCLELGAAEQRHRQLGKAAAAFLWKLSVFQENKQAMAQLGVVEKACQLAAAASSTDPETANVLFALLFNLSFDAQLRTRMVQQGLVNHVPAHTQGKCFVEAIVISGLGSEVALGLLYQLSIVDDARAMFAFTDAIAQVRCNEKHVEYDIILESFGLKRLFSMLISQLLLNPFQNFS